MRHPLTFADLEELELAARTDQDHRAAAATLTAWAEERHPDDVGVTPAALLCAAAWHLEVVGDAEGELELHRRSAAAGQVPPDVRCYLHGGLLRAGRNDEAREVADDIRRSAPIDPLVYLFMAGDFERAGDLRQAYRWLALGVARLDRADPARHRTDDYRIALLLGVRRRVRRDLGFPPDELDLLVPDPDDWSSATGGQSSPRRFARSRPGGGA